jgi:hypothetical protein
VTTTPTLREDDGGGKKQRPQRAWCSGVHQRVPPEIDWMVTPALVVGPGEGVALGLTDAADDGAGVGEGLAAACDALAVGDGAGVADGVAVGDGVGEPSSSVGGTVFVAPLHAASARHAAARNAP